MPEPDFPQTFDDEDTVESAQTQERARLVRLAATRAALDPSRREWRNDILVSAIVEVLALHGPRPTDQLVRSVQRVWGTETITSTSVERALAVASEARLVTTQQRLDGRDAWMLSEAARQEANQDCEWVARCFDTFSTRLLGRLNEVIATSVRLERGPRLAEQMFAALAHAAAGSLALGRTSDGVAHLRPAEFDVAALHAYIGQHVQPGQVASGLQEVGLAIVDPSDPLGEEILHLLVVGNILQSVLSGRDLAGSVDISGTRIALDTSALVPLAEDDTPERRLLVELLDRSSDAGVEVVVAEHTIDEWERLWEAADREMRNRTEDQLRRAARAYPYAGNPFVKAYLHAKQMDERLTWLHFQVGRRSVERELEPYGVTVRPHGNHREEDREVREAIEQRLLELSDEPGVRGTRSAVAAEADAETCAMVVRWRRDTPQDPPAGWIVARDTLTERAYKETVASDDRYPLILAPNAWMVFLTSVLADEPGDVNELAQTLSDAVTRDAFLSAAAAHTLDEVLELSAILAEHDQPISEEDVRLTLQLELQDVADEAGIPDSSERIRALGIEAVRKRSSRRDARAVRQHQLADERQRQMDQQLEDARREARSSAEESADAKIAELQEQGQRKDRTRTSLTIGGLVAVAIILGYVLGVIPTFITVALGVGWLLLFRRLYMFVTDLSTTLTGLLLGLIEVVAGMVLAGLIGWGLTNLL